VQRGRRLHREQRGSMRLGQVLHRRRVRGSKHQRWLLPERQPMHERELLEQPVLRSRAHRMREFLRLAFQQHELRELRAGLRRRLNLFGRILLSCRRPILHHGRPMSERRLQHLLCGFRRRWLRNQRIYPAVRHHGAIRPRRQVWRLLRQRHQRAPRLHHDACDSRRVRQL
jgi:hypothetical protein